MTQEQKQKNMKLYIVELENGLVSAVEADTMVQLFNDEKSNFYTMIGVTSMHFHTDNIELEFVTMGKLKRLYEEKGLAFETPEGMYKNE